MKKKYIITVLCAVMLSCFVQTASAEIVYLKDGQVINGSIIAEDTDTLVVKTPYQTRRISRPDVLRIMYGERKMEKIYLLMRDGTTITGYLVDQDAEKVIIRDSEKSKEERSISKSGIKQMSGSEIVPLDPSVSVRAGILFPLSTGGSSLNPAPIILAGSDITFQWIKNVRVLAEVGYSRSTSEHKNQYMQFVPFLVSARYDFSVFSFHMVPSILLGTTMIDYDDGEGSKTRSFAFTAGAGCGLVYEIIDRHLYAGLYPEYYFMRDSADSLHSIGATLGVSYRF